MARLAPLLLLALALPARADPAPEKVAAEKVERHLALRAGAAFLAVRDEYVSPYRYSGGATALGAEWGSRVHDLWSHVALEVESAPGAARGGVAAAVSQGRLVYAHEWRLRSFPFLGRQGEWLLGPAAVVAVHLRVQQVADRTALLSNFFDFYGELALAAASTLRLPLAEAWALRLEGAVELAAAGLKMVDFTKTGAATPRDPVVRLLLPLQRQSLRGAASLCWAAMPRLSLSARASFAYERTAAWDLLAVASDALSLEVAYAW
jgi:hypothetical protein